MSIQTKIKNVVHQYTDAERQVRAVTCKRPGLPSFTSMQKIAEKTNNAKEFSEIMHMIFRRLRDRNKRPLHTFKALILLDHLLKYGSDRVASMARDNVFRIDELKEYQDNDREIEHGINICAKARDVSRLLHDQTLLREEREKAIKRLIPRERPLSEEYMQGFIPPAQRSSAADPHSHLHYTPKLWKPPSMIQNSQPHTDIDSFIPSSLGEEELQLQLALAISKEEHNKEESRRRDEEAKIQMAIKESKRESEAANRAKINASNSSTSTTAAGCDGLGLYERVDTSLSVAPANQPNPWSAASTSAASAVPAATSSSIPVDDPWSCPVYDTPGATGVAPPSTSNLAWPGDPWSLQSSLGPPLFDIAINKNTNNNNSTEQSIFGAQGGGAAPPLWQPNWSAATTNTTGDSSGAFDPGNACDSAVANQAGVSDALKATGKSERQRTPADFLGEHKDLVDLDHLIVVNPASTNPFAINPREWSGGAPSNPFLSRQPPKPTLNELAPNRASSPQLALPAPFTSVFPMQQHQLLPIQNSVYGVPVAAVGSVAITTPQMPVSGGQFAWTTPTTSSSAWGNPGSSGTTASSLNPFY